jgi:hypothetical protein
MTNFDLALFMGCLPVLYFLIFLRRNQKLLVGQRITTNALKRTGTILKAGETHSLIKFKDGSKQCYRNSYFTRG